MDRANSYKYTRYFLNPQKHSHCHIQQTGSTITRKTTTAYTLEQSHNPIALKHNIDQLQPDGLSLHSSGLQSGNAL